LAIVTSQAFIAVTTIERNHIYTSGSSQDRNKLGFFFIPFYQY